MVTFKGDGAVRSPKGRFICRFIDGEFKTSDKDIIRELRSQGYVSNYVKPVKRYVPRKKIIQAMVDTE